MDNRIIGLQGVRNFRDFGGYAAGEGGRVRAGRLYRSAHFAEATGDDVATLDGLGVDLLVDLRRPEEREQEPNRWPGSGERLVTNDSGVAARPPHIAAAEESDWSLEGVRRYMRQAYAAYPYEDRYVALFGDFLRGVAEGEGAAVVHCAAGKDRTGCLCALTLTLLGTPHEAIVEDYLLTNRAAAPSARLPAMRQRIADRYGAAPSDGALLAMMGVEADYLEGYFGAIAARFHAIEHYAADVLGVDADAQARLRQRLLG
jgi:protein-tyrosine phosphatase